MVDAKILAVAVANVLIAKSLTTTTAVLIEVRKREETAAAGNPLALAGEVGVKKMSMSFV